MDNCKMLSEPNSRPEVLAAQLAPVRMNSTVHSHMNIPVPRLVESLATHVTRIGQFTCHIHSSVFDQCVSVLPHSSPVWSL